jgi:phosphoglycolate phosphatase
MALRAILFDLDGTLVQTRKASWDLFAETNREFALGIDNREAFFKLFEGNFFRSLETHCADKGKMGAAKEHFLKLLRTRYRPELIPGMADVVRALAAHFALAVLSTNTMHTIRRVLEEAGIASCFAHVFAGDVEPDKSASIRRFLSDRTYGFGRSCSPAYRETDGAQRPSSDEVALITDTIGDVKEARSCGIRAVGVAWGMHTQERLLAAGAEKVALWPQELVAWLVPEHASAQACGCAEGGACDAGAAGHTGPDHTKPARGELDARLQLAGEIRRQRRADTVQPAAALGPAAVRSPVVVLADTATPVAVQEIRSSSVGAASIAHSAEATARTDPVGSAPAPQPDVLAALARLSAAGRGAPRASS